jgi:GT2 family glycosyltransferase
MRRDPLDISVIIPVYNDPDHLTECVAAVKHAATKAQVEIIVVDDGSTDATPRVLSTLDVTVVTLVENCGQSVARNVGSRHASADLLLFIDTDVLVSSDVIEKVIAFFERDDDVAGVFGSYDADPRARGLVSQYRNLLHHFIHQTADTEASTFWTGCGAIRRTVFEELGGFNEDTYNGRVEDIEFGYRLKLAGHRIHIDPTVQATHLKKWTLTSMVKTDVLCRAVPWARLILSHQNFPNTLNVSHKHRVSAAMTLVFFLSLLLAVVDAVGAAAATASLTLVVLLNSDLFRFLGRQRGLLFSLGCVPLHLLYYLYGSLSFAYVWFVTAGWPHEASVRPGKPRVHLERALVRTGPRADRLSTPIVASDS